MVGRNISDELKEMALSMSLQGLRDSDIHEYTGISVRSLKRLRSTHRQTGEVSRKPVVPGRARDLTSMHKKVRFKVSHIIFVSQRLQFLCDCVERQPDLALFELQTELREVCGVETSVQTVARTLQREGYTMKTVRQSVHLVNALTLTARRSHGPLWSETSRIAQSSRL
jgi:transposase